MGTFAPFYSDTYISQIKHIPRPTSLQKENFLIFVFPPRSAISFHSSIFGKTGMEWKEIATLICISFFKKDVFNIVIGSLLPASLFFVFLYNFLGFPILVFVLFCLMLNHSKLIDIPKFWPILFWLKHTHETFETSLYRFQAVRYASTFNPKRVLFLDLYF